MPGGRMGSVPSRVRNVTFRRHASMRVEPIVGSGTLAATASNPTVVINIDCDEQAAEDHLTPRRLAFARASTRSLEEAAAPKDGGYADRAASLWRLADGTSLSNAEAQEFWSTVPCSATLKSNGWITARLIICGSLSDFGPERHYLHEHAFRELQTWCEADHIHLIVVDLFASLEREPCSSDFLELCLREIDRCTEAGVPVLFLGLLAETLGWTPDKHEVPTAVAEQYGWIHGLSLVEMMCLHAVYRNKSANALFLFREGGSLDTPTQKAQDQRRQSEDCSRLQHFKLKLTERFPEQIETYKPYNPSSGGTNAAGQNGKTATRDGLQICRQHVVTYFQDRIRRQFQMTDTQPVDAMERYRKHQDDELARKLNVWPVLPSPKTVERQVQLYINQGGQSPLLICSMYPGSGKTGVLSRSVNQLLKNGGHPYTMYGQRSASLFQSTLPFSPAVQTGKSWAVFHHFAGPQPRSTELTVLLQRIWNISELQSYRLGAMPSDLTQLVLQVGELLSKPPVERLTIFINNLDQIDDSDSKYLQKWLPRRLPENLRLVVTCSQRETKNKCWKVLQAHFPRAECVQLEMPRKQDCLEMVRSALPAQLCRRLGSTKLSELVDMMEDRTPMAVTEACRQLANFYRSNETASVLQLEEAMEAIVHNDLVGMLTDGLVDLESMAEFPKVLVAAALCLLHCSRAGLLESELLKMLGAVRAGDHQDDHLAATRGKFSSDTDVTSLSNQRTTNHGSDEAFDENSATAAATNRGSGSLPQQPLGALLEQVPSDADDGALSQGLSQQSIPDRSQQHSMHASADDNVHATSNDVDSPLPGATSRSRLGSYDAGQIQSFLEGMPRRSLHRRRQSMPVRSTSALMEGQQFVSMQADLDKGHEPAEDSCNNASVSPVTDQQGGNVCRSAKAPGLVHSDWHVDSVGELSSAVPFQSRFTQRNPDAATNGSSNTAGAGAVAAGSGGGMKKRQLSMSKSRFDKRSLFQRQPPPPPPDLPSLVWAHLIRNLQPWVRRVGDRTEARWALSHTVYHDVVEAYYFSRSPADRSEFPFHLNSLEFYNTAHSHFGGSQRQPVRTLAQRRASQFNLHLAKNQVQPADEGSAPESNEHGGRDGGGVTFDGGYTENGLQAAVFGAQHSNHKQLACQRYGWWHERLAGFFEENDDEDRRAEELPVHLAATRNETHLRSCLSRWRTFARVFTECDLGSLLDWWRQAGGIGAAVAEYRRELEYLQAKSTHLEMAFQRTKCAQLMFHMGGLEEAQLLLEEALNLLDGEGSAKDLATVHLAMAEVFNAQVQHMDVQVELEPRDSTEAPNYACQPSFSTGAADGQIDTTTTHPLAPCPPEDAMTWFTSELPGYERGNTSVHPTVKAERKQVSDEWMHYHRQLKDAVQQAASAVSCRAVDAAQKASELAQLSLPSLLRPPQQSRARQGSDAGVSSAASSRKSSILASRDSLLAATAPPASPLPRRVSHKWWPGMEARATGPDKESERGLLLLARASTLLCQHSQRLLAPGIRCGSEEEDRQRHQLLAQQAASQCHDAYQKLGDVVHQVTALLDLASTCSATTTAVPHGDGDRNPDQQSAELRAARHHLEEALTVAEQHVGEQHQLTAQVHHRLGVLAQCLAEHTAAAGHFRRWADVVAGLYGPGHPVTCSVRAQCRSMAALVGQKAQKNGAPR